MGECKGLVILDRGNGVSLVCEPTALGFPFYWMVNLTAADDLLVGFGGREAKTGTDEDGDGAVSFLEFTKVRMPLGPEELKA